MVERELRRDSGGGRDDLRARPRATPNEWWRSEAFRRGLTWAALIALAFGWGVTVMGISLATAAEGASNWWVILVFGAAAPGIVLAGAYLSRPARGPLSTRPGGPVEPRRPSPARIQPLPQSQLHEPLTDRELEILAVLATGRSNREIAGELYLATGTIKAHLHSIFRKLGATTRTEAVARARALQLLDDGSPQTSS